MRVSLGSVVPTSALKGMLGVVVESDQPLVAGARGMGEGDLGIVGASPTVTGPTAAIVPDGPSRLLLADAVRAGVVNLTVTDAEGKVLVAHKAVAITAQRGVAVTLPKGAAVVTIDPRNTSVAASLVSTAKKAVSVVPVRDTVMRAEVPAVHPH